MTYDRVTAKDGTDVTGLSCMKLRKYLGDKGMRLPPHQQGAR